MKYNLTADTKKLAPVEAQSLVTLFAAPQYHHDCNLVYITSRPSELE